MKYNVFAVKDRAIPAYGTPYYAASVGSAIRGFSDEVNRKEPNNQLAAHPDDFDLYHLGTFDDAFAKFELFEEPVQVARGKDFCNLNS